RGAPGQICTGFSTDRWKTGRCATLGDRDAERGEAFSARSRQDAEISPEKTLKTFLRLAAIGVISFGALLAQATESATIAPYYPTPETIVERMLQLGALKAGEKMYDLGSGDGRIVIMAAQRFHAEAAGVELDKDLAERSAARILKLGLGQRAHIIQGDLLK